jgi:two-component sensor histidine kinase
MILAELLSNAFQHAFEAGHGRISVTVQGSPDGSAQVDISDSGPGFDEKAAMQGTGIGLTLVRNFARQADIAISLDPGPGAHWRLRLPPPRDAA